MLSECLGAPDDKGHAREESGYPENDHDVAPCG